MELNKFNINDFVQEQFEMKCLFLFDDIYAERKIYAEGKIVRSKNFITVYLYDLWKNQYLQLHESQVKNISLYAVIE